MSVPEELKASRKKIYEEATKEDLIKTLLNRDDIDWDRCKSEPNLEHYIRRIVREELMVLT